MYTCLPIGCSLFVQLKLNDRMKLSVSKVRSQLYEEATVTFIRSFCQGY